MSPDAAQIGCPSPRSRSALKSKDYSKAVTMLSLTLQRFWEGQVEINVAVGILSSPGSFFGCLYVTTLSFAEPPRKMLCSGSRRRYRQIPFRPSGHVLPCNLSRCTYIRVLWLF